MGEYVQTADLGDAEAVEVDTALAWTPLTDVEQTGPLVDPTGLTTTGTGFNQDTGRYTIVATAHTTLIDGYHEGVVRVTKKMSDIVGPGFAADPLKYRVEICAKLVTWTHANSQLGMMIGIQDHSTVDGSLAGVFGGVRMAGAAQDQVHQVGPTDLVGTASNAYLLDEFHLLIQFVQSGTGYVAQIFMSGINEANGQKVGILQALTTTVLRAAELEEWRMCAAWYHDSTTSTAGLTAAVDLAYRVTELDTVPFQ